MNTKKNRLNFKWTVLLIGYIPLLTANIILTIVATHTLRNNLEDSTYLRLKACATSVEQYFIWDINEDILAKDEVSYQFIDSLKEDDIELTFFENDTAYLTSMTDNAGNRIEDTKVDSTVWETIKQGNDYQSNNTMIEGTKYYSYYTPVKSESGEVIGMAFAGEKATTVNAAAKSLERKMYAIDTVLLIIFGFILFRLASMIRKPINKISQNIDILAGGNLKENINAKSALSETNILINAAKTLQDKIGYVVTNVSESAKKMNDTVNNLDQLANTSSTGTQQINQTMEELAKVSVSLAENVQEVNSKVIDMGDEITEIKNRVENLNENTEYMKMANKNAAESMDVVMNSSNKSVEAVDNISEQIQSTNDAIAEITNAVSLILDITSQTKLLSLNANIEAARAGELGRGFAVVASEIKNLSEQSAEGAEKIRTIAENILKKSEESVGLTKDIKDIIMQEQKNIIETQKNFETLTESIEKNIMATGAINEKALILDELKEGIISNVNDLSAISEENAASNQEVTANVINIAESMENITDGTANIKTMSEELEELIKYFNI